MVDGLTCDLSDAHRKPPISSGGVNTSGSKSARYSNFNVNISLVVLPWVDAVPDRHEHACFGRSSPFALPVMFGHTTPYRSSVMAFSAAFYLAMKRSVPCSTLLALFPLVPDCSRPLVGIDTESFEVVQEIPRPFFFLPSHVARASHQLS